MEGVAPMVLEPTTNTWSRAARRQAARQIDEEVSKPHGEDELGSDHQEPIMRVRLSVFAPSVPEEDTEGAGLRLEYLWGRERAVMEGFWKCLLSKAGLVGKRAPEEDASGSQGRGRGRIRINLVRGRGRDTGWRGRGRGLL
jgi:hypothetical protein